MKTILIAMAAAAGFAAAPAFAADMPVKAPVMAAPAFSWTGCYVGINGGYTRQTDRSHLAGTDTDGGGFGAELADGSTLATFNSRFSGLIGGGQIGCNYQTGSFVWGLEGDIDGGLTGHSAFQTNLPQPPFPARSAITTGVSNSLDWISTVRARLGYTITERWMFYVTGGGAFGGTTLTESSFCPTCAPARNLLSTSRQSKGGFTAGWGNEYSLGNNWSLQSQTLYYDLGRNTTAPMVYTYGANTSTMVASTRERGWLTRVGVNYKFN